MPQNDFKFLGDADKPPSPFMPSIRNGYIVIEVQYGAMAPANDDSSCLYITWSSRSRIYRFALKLGYSSFSLLITIAREIRVLSFL